MATIYDVNPSEFIKKTASSLKNLEGIKEPEWAQFVKTGAHKERPPAESDWWFVRAASVLRKVYILGPVGVSKLRRKYGGKKNRGHKPGKFYNGSGNILRKILQQLEKEELIVQVAKGVHKGRVVTPKGKKLIDKMATELFGGSKKSKPLKKEKKNTESSEENKPIKIKEKTSDVIKSVEKQTKEKEG